MIIVIVIVHLQLISEVSGCIFALNTQFTGLQTNISWILDIICVWVLVVAALMVFVPSVGVNRETLFSKTNVGYISCQTPAYV